MWPHPATGHSPRELIDGKRPLRNSRYACLESRSLTQRTTDGGAASVDIRITGELYIEKMATGFYISMSKSHDLLFKTLADPTRRALFERLCREGEQTVGALTARAGVSQPAVSKHLGVLKRAGLVRDRSEGRQTHYGAQVSALAPLIDWTGDMARFWQSRFDRLEDLLKRMDQ
jgi:DNA-binding transcriptional ArsR family regulator